SGQAPGHHAGAVIAAPARDDLLLLGPAQNVVVVPDELDLRLVRVGAGKAVIDAAHALGRLPYDPLGQSDRRLARMPDIGVVVGEPLGLLMDRVGDLRPAVADIHAVEAGEGVERLAPFAVDGVDAVAAGDDPVRGAARRVLAERGWG